MNGGRGRNRTADTGIFNLARKFKKTNLNQPLAALAQIYCVTPLIPQRTSVRHAALTFFNQHIPGVEK
jgi:hypothetical protein